MPTSRFNKSGLPPACHTEGANFDSSCAGLTRASIEKMIQLDVMDCRVKPGNDDVEGQRLVPQVSAEREPKF
jgi:hypothetical protein